jgi:ABC-type multidrug transport system ATPase subunit
MEINIENLGKRFNRYWIFRRLTYSFQPGNAYAITGPNGSGKSTLLQVVAGATEKSEGRISFVQQGGPVPLETQYKSVAICAPYMELIEELTLSEFLKFNQQFRPWLPGLDVKTIIDKLDLKEAAHRIISQFSSGMKQRVKLAQALLADVPVVLLDEPTSNLDVRGIALYHALVAEFQTDRILMVASNDEQEISFCRHRINILDFRNEKVAS